MKSLARKAVQKMTGYTPGEQPKVKGLIKLNTNENPYPPSPKVFDAVRRFAPGDLRLYPDPVSGELREAIARYHGCDIDQVFVGNGSDEVLALCTRAFVEPSGTIGYFEPSYSLYPVLAAIQDVKTKPVRLNKDFSWTMPKGYRASLFFLANPNAPTSVQYPAKTVRDFCRRFKGVVLIDEAYADFARENHMELALTMKNVLVARTFSKSFSLAGLRLGYMIGSKALIAAIYKIKDSYNLNRLIQRVALAAIQDVAHMRMNVAKIKATREMALWQLLDRGFTVLPSETNFLWAKPPKRPAAVVFRRLRERKILVRYFPGKPTGEYLRISVGTNREMAALIKALDAILR